MKQLCELLKNQECKLQELLLQGCSIGEEGCAALNSALSSNPSHLREFDLQGNKLGESIKQLYELMKKSGCNLRLDKSTLDWITGWLPWNWGKKHHHKKGTESSSEQNKNLSTENQGEASSSEPNNDLSTENQGEARSSAQNKNSSTENQGEVSPAEQNKDASTENQDEASSAEQNNDSITENKSEARSSAPNNDSNTEK
ncbi:probable serine/threonine-protein kinase DDB_G0288147 [Astyanax mexicanus]|uniref:probable serine/threonine-protein kinase DDB_G0288147 n=1 Tax=Astyanax mexicanus TaxID=7994 RepID=UPI0020CB0844|nr:probable serine/threonine-protein kinase DDB_G0288147 [Astyanax mexicanus]